VAYNWKAKEKRDKDLKEELERKERIKSEIKLQKQLKKQQEKSGKMLGFMRSRSAILIDEARQKMKEEQDQKS